MANHPPDSSRNPRDGGRRSLRELMESGNGASASGGRGGRPAAEEKWDREAAASEDLETTSAEETEHILASLRGESRPRPGSLADEEEPMASSSDGSAEAQELLEENDRLRSIIADLRQMLDDATAKAGGESFDEREREYESLLEEKSELIRNLHVQIKDLEDQVLSGGGGGGGSRSGGGSPDDSELLALSDELERERSSMEQERRTLEDERRQLREDEESMMRQMREMELGMAKERAELARQRNELQRLHSEIRHELELAQRDAAVNERLKLLQRRHQDVANNKGGGGGDEEPPPPKPTRKSSQGTQPAPKKTGSSDSGMFRRLFRGDK